MLRPALALFWTDIPVLGVLHCVWGGGGRHAETCRGIVLDCLLFGSNLVKICKYVQI